MLGFLDAYGASAELPTPTIRTDRIAVLTFDQAAQPEHAAARLGTDVVRVDVLPQHRGDTINLTERLPAIIEYDESAVRRRIG